MTIFLACQDNEELVPIPYVGKYELRSIQVKYLTNDILDLTPVSSNLEGMSFSLFEDYTYKVDTSFINYFFFLDPGKAFTRGQFIGIWSLDNDDQISTGGLELISFSMNRNYFLIYREPGGIVHLKTETTSQMIPDDVHLLFFDQIGSDLGKKDQLLFQQGRTFDEGFTVGSRFGYYTGYAEQYRLNSLPFEDVAIDPIQQYATSYLEQIDTLSNSIVQFKEGFRQGMQVKKELGMVDADSLFTQESKVLSFDFEFQLTQ